MSSIRFRPSFYISGILLTILSLAMTLPIIVDLRNGFEEWREFSKAQIITAFFGIALMLINKQNGFRLSTKETLIAATLPWVIVSFFAALPFMLAVNLGLSPIQSLFEAVSGVTTTGSTAVIGLNEASHGIILWRSLLSWLGGMGFILVSLAVFPFLEIGGMQIFNTQSSGSGLAITAAKKAIGLIVLIYSVLTAACFTLLVTNKIPAFESFCLSLSTISTGGFHADDRSITALATFPVQMILILFMFISALPFLALLKVSRGQVLGLFHEPQVKFFIGLILVLTSFIAFENIYIDHINAFDGILSALFITLSSLSTTGFHIGDHATWGPITFFVLFSAMFIGGCAGSSASGVKIFRLQILKETVASQLRRIINPNAVFEARYNTRAIDMHTQVSVVSFFVIFTFTWVAFSFALILAGVDLKTAFFSAGGAMTNMPLLMGNIADIPGYVGTMGEIPTGLLTMAMLTGRLEILVFLSLLLPRFWLK